MREQFWIVPKLALYYCSAQIHWGEKNTVENLRQRKQLDMLDNVNLQRWKPPFLLHIISTSYGIQNDLFWPVKHLHGIMHTVLRWKSWESCTTVTVYMKWWQQVEDISHLCSKSRLILKICLRNMRNVNELASRQLDMGTLWPVWCYYHKYVINIVPSHYTWQTCTIICSK